MSFGMLMVCFCFPFTGVCRARCFQVSWSVFCPLIRSRKLSVCLKETLKYLKNKTMLREGAVHAYLPREPCGTDVGCSVHSWTLHGAVAAGQGHSHHCKCDHCHCLVIWPLSREVFQLGSPIPLQWQPPCPGSTKSRLCRFVSKDKSKLPGPAIVTKCSVFL